MTDYKIPDLPSDDELGITSEDLEELADDEAPELSDKEKAALLGGPERPAPPPPPPGGEPPKKAAPGPEEPTGPRSRWRGPGMLAALAALAWMTSSSRLLPAPEPANAPDTAFSSARAMAHLVEIARRPHPPGSPAHAQARAYLVERLGDLGLAPEVRTTTSMIGRGDWVRAATVRNVVARIPGTASTGAVVLTAHYDGREISRAAGDDGAGVVTILETARALRAGAPLRNDVLVVLTDGEELGLLGARAFVGEDPDMAGVAVVLSVEMRGGGGPSVMFETGADNGWIIRELQASGARPYANSLSHEIYRRLPNDTDFTPFKAAGRQGLNFAAIGRASVYHQAYDAPENLSEATLQHHGDNVLALARSLGEASLADATAPDVVYFSLPVLGTLSYGTGFVLPLSAAVLALAALVLLVVRRAGGTWAGILVGLGLTVVAGGGAAAAGWGLTKWLPRFHPEFGSLQGSAFHREGWYVLALAAAALFLATSLFGLARRRFTAGALTWGALLVPLATVVWLSFAFPAAAMNLQWPLAAALVGAALLVVPSRGRTAGVLWAALLLLAVPVLAFLTPAAEFLWLGLSFSAAPVLGGVLTLVLLLLLPALERLREPNAWWAPAASLALAGAFLGLGIRASRPTPERPAPSTLAYALDRGTGEALWASDGSAAPVDGPARAWAAERAGASFTETRSLERFGYRTGDAAVAAAPVVDVPGPEVWAVADTVVDGVRRLRLAVRSAVGAELLELLFPEGGGTRLTALNGRPLPVEERPTRVEHWGAPDPAILLDLEMAPDVAPEMDVVEHLLRPWELLGPEPFQRPAELAPDITRMSDRAMLRTPAASLVIVPGPPPFSLEPEAASAGAPVDATPGVAMPAADTVPVPDTVPPDTAVARATAKVGRP